MTSAERGHEIERILVAMDASPQSLAALEAAAELAAKFEAELIGIFIEDVNLLRLAELPIAREIDFYSMSLRQLDSPQIERQLRARARWVQGMVAQVAEKSHLRWSFRVARGIVHLELLAASTDADLIILGKSGWSGRRRVGSTTRLMVLQSPHRTLVLQSHVRLGLPVMVAFDGSETGYRALAAARVVMTDDSLITVLILAEAPERAQQLQSEAINYLREFGLEAQYSWRQRVDGYTISRLLKSGGCGILVLPVESEQLTPETPLIVLHETKCGVLLVR